MASKKISDMLPPLPPSLKSISSYIQRAEELRTKDPVMAYWCTYYAAQLGLDLKSHEPGARDYLYAVITLLEGMKKDLAGNDAVEHEAAGAAYVENFALKVFTLADNEDRKGEASRSTAKKFLAAANFLELLRVFEKSNNAEVNEEKVRYAKWKASDIAKAFREGRKPAAGAAQNDMEGPADNLATSDETPVARSPASRSPAAPAVALSPESNSPIISSRTPPSATRQLPGFIDVPPDEVSNSGTWSTVATPGSEAVGPSSTSTKLAFASAINRWKGQADAEVSASASAPGGQNNLAGSWHGTTDIDTSAKKVHFSPSVVGGLSSTDGSPPPSPVFKQPGPAPSTLYNNYVPGMQSQNTAAAGTSSFGRPDPTMAPLPDSSPSGSSRTSPEGTPPQVFNNINISGRPRSGSSPRMDSVPKPSGFLPNRSPPRPRRSSLQASAPPPLPPPPPTSSGGANRRPSVSSRTSPISPNLSLYSTYQPSQSPNSASLSYTPTFASPVPGRTSGSPNRAPLGLPSVASNQPPPTVYGTSYVPKQPSPPTRYQAPAPEPSPTVDLTPALIAKAQKHCRYAISSLEYEDAEQARKELRAALALLGDR